MKKNIKKIINSLLKKLGLYNLAVYLLKFKTNRGHILKLNLQVMNLKKEIGSAIPSNTQNTYIMKGRDVRTGVPKEVKLTEK